MSNQKQSILMLRERFHANPDSIADDELLSLVGVKLKTESESVLKYLDMTKAELIAAGFKEDEIAAIKAIKEVATRYLGQRMASRNALRSPAQVVEYLRMKIGGLPHEAFAIIFLNVQSEVIKAEILNEGTIDQVAVYPRRIIEKALECHAGGVILGHNHPSGHIEPSDEDKILTRTVQQAGKLLDIRVLDHLIVSTAAYFSFVERGIL